jgi:hypothetical protein
MQHHPLVVAVGAGGIEVLDYDGNSCATSAVLWLLTVVAPIPAT